jgi:hypothetical protein
VRRGALGLAVAVLALSGAGSVTLATTAVGNHSQAAAHAATSTTAKPSAPAQNGTATAFGQQVKAQVATCKGNLQAGQHGIGSCVSAFASGSNPSNTNTNSTGAAAAHKNH